MDKIKVYMVTDIEAISLLVNDSLAAFKTYISSQDSVIIDEPMKFDTELEALAFCAGLGYGKDDYSVPEIYPLRSSEPCDLPYIEAIESLA